MRKRNEDVFGGHGVLSLLGGLFAVSAVFPAAFAGDAPADLGIFSLKDGRFHVGEAEVDIEVNEVPDGVKGPLRFWSVFQDDEEIGVWFFSEGCECLAFLPLESEFECRGMHRVQP